MKILNPDGWPRPSGYSNGIEAEGRMVFVAGMIGWTPDGKFENGFLEQLAQCLRNTLAVLAESGAGAEHIVRMTWFVKDLNSYRQHLPEIGKTYRAVMGRNFPAMAVLGVSDLVERDALLEIETTAVIATDP